MEMRRRGISRRWVPGTAVALAGLAALLVPGAASAHPEGIPPQAAISRDGDAVRIIWVAAADDFLILTHHLGLGPYAPTAVADRPEFEDYFRTRVDVVAGDSACEKEIRGVEPAGPGYAVRMSFDCGTRPGLVTVGIWLLHDIDDRYTTLAEAHTAAGRSRAPFTFDADPMSIDFDAPPPEGVEPVDPDPEPEAPAVDLSGRIIAMLQGESGAGPLPLLLALGVAFVIGAAHALTPGHGKTIAAAYLIGGGGNMRQALLLGGVVSVSHAVSTAALGLAAIASGQLLLPARWMPWIEAFVGVMIIALGVMILRPPAWMRHTHTAGEDHDHGPAAGEVAGHEARVPAAASHGRAGVLDGTAAATRADASTEPGPAADPGAGKEPAPVGALAPAGVLAPAGAPDAAAATIRGPMPIRRLSAVGFIGGLVPNPEAIAIVLIAFSLSHWLAGALLVLAFSIGLAVVVVGVAVAAVGGGRLIRRVAGSRFTRVAPLFAGIVFLGMGAFVLGRALWIALSA